ncbi:MAG: hypothetical protein QOJ00_2066 [Actinomycetota bacterium]
MTLRNPRVLIPAVLVLVVAIIGVVAVKSRGSDSKPLHTNKNAAANCPPLARNDAVATKPGQAVSVDVLANDVDPDGDPLVFQILNTTGGTATVADGGTPTDAGDDRLAFTPSDPPVDGATVKYQALDPQGAYSNGTLTVYVNPTAALPAGVQSESPDAPLPEGTESTGRCGTPTSSTTIDEGTTGPVGPDTAGVTTTVAADSSGGGSRTATTTRHGRTTTTMRHSTARGTTTTAKTSPKTTAAPGPGPTEPPHTTTTHRTTTTAPHTTSPPPTDPSCPDPRTNPSGFHDCQNAHARGKPWPPPA